MRHMENSPRDSLNRHMARRTGAVRGFPVPYCISDCWDRRPVPRWVVGESCIVFSCGTGRQTWPRGGMKDLAKAQECSGIARQDQLGTQTVKSFLKSTKDFFLKCEVLSRDRRARHNSRWRGAHHAAVRCPHHAGRPALDTHEGMHPTERCREERHTNPQHKAEASPFTTQPQPPHPGLWCAAG
jgi:hypothetical protein